MNRAFLAVGADFPGTHSTWRLTHICKSPHHDGALPKSVLTQGWCAGRWQIWAEPSTDTETAQQLLWGPFQCEAKSVLKSTSGKFLHWS